MECCTSCSSSCASRKPRATGFFSSAFAIGNGADASSIGALDIASAVGPDSRAGATGNLNIAGALGFTGGTKYTQANAGNGSSSFANIAVSLGSDSFAGANDASPGSGNLALNLGQGNNVVAAGYLSTAISVGGNQSYVNNNVKTTGGVLNTAFSLFGNQNSVTAGPGPFAIAGSIFQNGQPVTKVNPGFNINGLKVPNTATAVRTGNKTAAPAAATNNRRQKPAPAATATGRGKR